MELGVLVHTAHRIRDDNVDADLEGVITVAEDLEAAGADRIWLGDSSRMEKGWPRAHYAPILGAIAARTDRIGLGVVPLSAPLRNPVMLAHELATIDVLAAGRLIVAPAIGKGGEEGRREFISCGVDYRERGARLDEILQILRLLWTEPSVHFAGKYFSLSDASVYPKPHQRPIPQYVATGRNQRALARAGEYGDGWFTSGGSLEDFRQDRAAVTRAAVESGRLATDVAPTGLYVTVHLETSDERAREEGVRYLEAYFGAHAPRRNNVFGSPVQVARHFEGFAQAGLTMLAIRFVDPDLRKQVDLMREALTLL